jgi:hypothetical protein
MNTLTINPAALAGIGLALIGLLAIWRGGRTSAARAAGQAHEVTRMGGTFLRTTVIATVIVGIQWAVVVHTDNPTTVALVLGIPALLAGITAARFMAVTEVTEARKGIRR